MTTDLTDDLRDAFHQRAAEIPDRDAPGLVVGYTAAAPHRSRRLPYALVAGAVAAGLLTIAFVSGGSSEPKTTTTTLAQSATTEVPSQVTPEPHDGAFITGEVEGHRWELISTRTPEGGDDVHLEADGMEGTFHGEYTITRMDMSKQDQDKLLFAQIGPCCRLAGHTMLVGVFAPDVLTATVTPNGGTPIEAATFESPGATDGYRFMVVPVPPGHTTVRIEAHRADGTTELVGDGNWQLDLTTLGG
jgi:hypothetical protein